MLYDIIILESSISFCNSQIITLTLNSKSKIRKINIKENKNMK